MEHNDANIIVSSVHPGWVKTDMGGEEAPMTPEEAAAHICTLALSQPESGQFWFKGEKYPW
jgi:NAD(P)-dependent dehydrogenase (short-subunit alcohol dehydrogenase family)